MLMRAHVRMGTHAGQKSISYGFLLPSLTPSSSFSLSPELRKTEGPSYFCLSSVGITGTQSHTWFPAQCQGSKLMVIYL